MSSFINEDFMLSGRYAKELYHGSAEHMPIIDYHCHLIPRMIAENWQFKDITELWLGGDHYKWRAMRGNGVPEEYITGGMSSWEKFEKWAETVPYTMRNPLYHWTHLELKRVFGIDKLLSPATARDIFEECNAKLATAGFRGQELIRKFNVETVCTTDDPADDLRYHKQIMEHPFGVKVIPAWRPDKAMAIEDPKAYKAYLTTLGEAAGMEIRSYSDLIEALRKRHRFFESMGCKLSDHGIEEFYDEEYTDTQIETIFAKALSGQSLSDFEVRQYKNCFLTVMAEMDADAGWTQQFHYGAIRDNNTKMYNQLGPDTGFDSIGEFNTARAMSRFLNKLNMEDKLTRTILYTLNPCANEVIATMLGNFQGGEPGKIQFGSGWWFNDQLDGMTRQINALSVLGLLSRFVGMLTDSRSFLSYPRHEYFRRLLCNILGNDVEKGLLPNDHEILSRMVEDISYNNAKRYFKFY